MYYMNGYFGNGMGTISLILVFLVKIFIFLLIITMLVGLFMSVKKFIFSKEDLSAYRNTFSSGARMSQHCTTCGMKVKHDWKVCPYCGNDLSSNWKEESEYEKSMV
jgi:endogenous inhibitor of DNA gyrase (YacG/DUF329 family)